MKKITLSIFLALLVLGLFTGVAAAQGDQPPREARGVMHEYIEHAVADELGLTHAEVEIQFDAGATFWQIALDNGITEADLPAFMQKIHQAAITAAVADGVLTQTQADQMLQRMAKRGYGSSTCPMSGTRPQNGTGWGMGIHRGGRGQHNTP